MPRRDLTAERTAQILDALERCVVRSGLDATSLEEVAREAGVKRSILRHYVGNRDQLVLAMAERAVDRHRDELRELAAMAEDPQRVEVLLEALFPREETSRAQDGVSDVALLDELFAAAPKNAAIRRLLTAAVDETVEAVKVQLLAAFPGADAELAWTIAYGVVAICFNQSSLAPALALPDTYRLAARAAARQLIESLDG